MKKYNFVYLTTNLVNGKQYVGDHSCNDLKKDVYFGSGIYIQYALNEYKYHNFQRKILEFFPTKLDAFNSQEKYIIKYNTLVPNGYNISPKGGHNVKECFSEESINKIKESNKGKHFERKGKTWEDIFGKEKAKQYKQHLKEIKIGKALSQSHKDNIGKGISGEKNGMFGKNHKPYSIEKMKNRLFSKETKDLMSKNHANISGENNPMYRIKIEKIICQHCNKLIDKRNYSRWHGDKCKYKK